MKVAFVGDAFEKIGLQCISSVLKKQGHQTKLFYDPQLLNDENMSLGFLSRVFGFRERIIRELLDYQPQLVGFSVVSDFYGWACDLARAIKEVADIPIIFGGIHPTSVPERVIANDCVDMVCIGEGEYPLLEVAESMQKGRPDYNIKNIWFKKNGKVIRNELRPLIQDLDSLPFPDKELYYSVSPHFKRSYFAMSGRGCLYSCAYCCNSFLRNLYKNKGKYLRRRSVDNLIEEITDSKKKYKIDLVRFHDDIFTYDLDWLKQFSLKYRKEVDLPFSCYIHPGTANEAVAGYLKRAGCCEAEIGIQTIRADTREKVLSRFVSNSQTERAINIFKDLGIRVTVNNIFGIPGQSEEEISELAEFFNENRVTRLYFYGLRYYPKTKITQDARNAGILSEEDIYRIENGIDAVPFVQGGDSIKDKRLGRFRTLFTLLPYLPKGINRFLINKRIYRFFPVFPYYILVIFSNWLRIRYKYNWMLRRTVVRYPLFMMKKVFGRRYRKPVIE